MKSSSLSLLAVLALGLAVAPAAHAAYQPASVALQRLENIITLTPAQEKQALQIFQNLKDIMDSMNPADRPAKGAQYRQDAIAAIRAILTPEQQAIYDSTPQRLGGSGKAGDPDARALHLKIQSFVYNFAKTSPAISSAVGTVSQIVPGTTSTTNITQGGDVLHPSSGTNSVTVTGSAGTKTFKVSWTMDSAGNMAVTQLAAQ